jgi:uncharacterized protein (DUF1499 family)
VFYPAFSRSAKLWKEIADHPIIHYITVRKTIKELAMRNTWMVMGFAVLFMGCTGSRPALLGVTNGKFIPCPDSPNCVCSQYPDQSHEIEPLIYKGSPEEASTRLLVVIQGMKRAKVVTAEVRYLHVEFTSAVFHFVDDTEFFIDDTQKAIHLRSAARLGYYDFGVNRKRLETIRQKFNGTLL